MVLPKVLFPSPAVFPGKERIVASAYLIHHLLTLSALKREMLLEHS